MSDKKEWREFTVRYLEPPTGCGMTRTFDPAIKLIQTEAYEAEKQRADSVAKKFKSYRKEMSSDYSKQAERVDRLEYALRALLSDTQHSDHDCGSADCPVELARKALNEQN